MLEAYYIMPNHDYLWVEYHALTTAFLGGFMRAVSETVIIYRKVVETKAIRTRRPLVFSCLDSN